MHMAPHMETKAAIHSGKVIIDDLILQHRFLKSDLECLLCLYDKDFHLLPGQKIMGKLSNCDADKHIFSRMGKS